MDAKVKQSNGNVTDAKSNFGVKGWIMILYLFLGFFLSTSLGSDLCNVFIPAFSEAKGWETAALYGIVTVSGIISVFAVIVFGLIIRKTGARTLALAGLAVNIVVMFLRPFVDTLWQYNLLFVLNNLCAQVVVYVSAGALTANWFPRKKGLVMGWATMGASLSTCCSSVIFRKLLSAGGLKLSFFCWAVIPIVMFLIALFFIKDNPEECGYNPDNDKNMTAEMAQKMLEEGKEYMRTSPWTLKKLFTTRYAWLVAAGTGPLLMLSVGIMSSIVSRIQEVGFSIEQALVMMAISGVIGLFGSYFAGYIDTKFGTKKATMILYIWIIIALVFNLLSGQSLVFFYISLIMIGSFIGGANNMPVSMIATVFGRYDYSSAYRVCWPVAVIIQSLGFALVGALAASLGSYKVPYLILIVCSVIGIICTKLLPDKCVGRN